MRGIFPNLARFASVSSSRPARSDDLGCDVVAILMLSPRSWASVRAMSGSSRSGPCVLRSPAGLSTLFFTEMWERFSYYGMRAFLILYMIAPTAEGGLGMPTTTAGIVMALYTVVGLPAVAARRLDRRSLPRPAQVR